MTIMVSALRGLAGTLGLVLVVGCGSDFESTGGATGGGTGVPDEPGGAGGKFAAMASGGASAGRSGSGGSAAGGEASGGQGVAGSGAGGRVADPVCIPGKSEPCTGPGGCQGGQACKDDGSGFEACACEAGGAGGAMGSGGASGSEPPTFTGPDGQQWACQRLTSGDGHRCECTHYPVTGHPWHCNEPDYDCSPVPCTVYSNDCCFGYSDRCQCIGPVIPHDCSKVESPATSCP